VAWRNCHVVRRTPIAVHNCERVSCTCTPLPLAIHSHQSSEIAYKAVEVLLHSATVKISK
jgi:hypothetical protein